MIRIAPIPALLVLGTGCMSLDFMFLNSGPNQDTYTLHDDVVPAELVELVDVPREDGLLLKGVWVRQSEPAPPLIFFHGNDSNIETNWDRISYMWEWGTYDVFAIDYAGFGLSEGESTWEGLSSMDGHATVNYVSSETGYAPEEIPWVALSLGGFVSIRTNDEIPAQSIILESVFASSDALQDDSLKLDLPAGWMFENEWDNVAEISKIQSPVFIIHGLKDDFIMPSSAPELYDAAPTEKELWQPAEVDHSDLFEVEPEEFKERAHAWFNRFNDDEAPTGATTP